VLGVGGALLRRKSEGATIGWLIVTGITAESGWDDEKIEKRADEIRQITALFGFDSVFELNFPTTQLDHVPMSDLVTAISNVFKTFEPEEVFVPHPSDVHTDHRVVFEAVASCTKWFRYPSVKRVLAYETLSETDFGLGTSQAFRPNVFINIEAYLPVKLQAMNIYASEVGDFPFPRSHEAIRALSTLRGATSGFNAAEAFELLRERF
jgi:LmbE family N-acetylglucosaminyl deacetylase